jgi:hypothetical protein
MFLGMVERTQPGFLRIYIKLKPLRAPTLPQGLIKRIK